MFPPRLHRPRHRRRRLAAAWRLVRPDRPFRSAADVERALPLPVLTSIPAMDAGRHGAARPRRAWQKLWLGTLVGLLVWGLAL